jgi:hypothetical protein
MGRRTGNRKPSIPLTEDDQIAWVHVLERCPSIRHLYINALITDERDALIMYAAQVPGSCECCGARFAALETQTGGLSTWIQYRLHRHVRQH